MGGDVVPPCSELGQSGEHRLLFWMSGRAKNKHRVVPLEYDEIVRRGWDRSPGRNEQRLVHLVDGGYLERVDFGESFSFRVLVPCKENPLILSTRPSGGRAAMVASTDAAIAAPITSVVSQSDVRVGNFNGPRSAPNYVTLARDIFPQVVSQTPLQSNWPALAINLKRWPEKYGIDFPLVHQMMEEFARHPEWCRRSRNAPWRVFLTHRQDLVDRVLHQQRKDPAARVGHLRGEEYWFGGHTPRAYSPA